MRYKTPPSLTAGQGLGGLHEVEKRRIHSPRLFETAFYPGVGDDTIAFVDFVNARNYFLADLGEGHRNLLEPTLERMRELKYTIISSGENTQDQTFDITFRRRGEREDRTLKYHYGRDALDVVPESVDYMLNRLLA